jgi:hypothetical protein
LVRERLTFVLSACALLLATRRARASDADTLQRAEALFQGGREAMRSEDYAAACPKFAESQQLAPALGTLLNLALCDEQLGRTATATLLFEQFLDRAATDDERRPLVIEHLETLRPRAPRLVLQLVPGEPAGFRVALDGRPLSRQEISQPILLDPGVHALATSTPGGPWRETTIALGEGQVEVRTLAATNPPGESPRERPHEGATSGPGSRVPAYIVGGFGALGLLAGIVTGVMVLDERRVVEAHCRGDLCDEQGLQANNAGRTLLVANAIAYSLGAAGVAGGVYLYLSAPRGYPSPSSQPASATSQARGPTSLWVGVSGTF